MSPDKRTALLEIGLVVATGAVHLIFENLFDLKVVFIGCAVLFWGGYLTWRVRSTPGLLQRWGFTRSHFRGALLASGSFTVIGGGAMIAFGFAYHTLPPKPTFWLILMIYPAWGIVQQFLLCALLARNLDRLVIRPIVVLLSALLFGLAHWPDEGLVGLTIVAGIPWSMIYLRWPNLWVIGVSHGILGTLAYYAVLYGDAWELTFG